MKYAIVTGASPSSIGFQAAKQLASAESASSSSSSSPSEKSAKFKVILACRNEQKGREAEALIRSAHPYSQVIYVHLDLSSFDSIRKFVDDVHALDDGAIPKQGLQLLVNNAGVGFGRGTPYIETIEGLEEIVGVNHFGTFLLTQLLLNDLKRAEGTARVVIVSSSLHDANSWKHKASKSNDGEDNNNLVLPNFPDGILQSKEDYDGFKAYQVSKLCNVWFTYELQRRLDAAALDQGKSSSSVRVNALSPGFIPTTGLSRRSGWLGTLFLHYILDPWRYIGLGITRSPAEGGEVIVQTAVSDIASKGGQYFARTKGKDIIEAVSSSEESMDESKAKELWEISMKTCKL